jgi:hypothetical protein
VELDKTIEEVKEKQKKLEKLAKFTRALNIAKSGLSGDIAGTLNNLLGFIKTKSIGLQYAKEFVMKTAGAIATPPEPITATLKMLIDAGIKWYGWRQKEKMKKKLEKQMKLQKMWLKKIDGKLKEWAKKERLFEIAEKIKFGYRVKVDTPIPQRLKGIKYPEPVFTFGLKKLGLAKYYMHQLDKQLYNLWEKGDVEKYKERKKELQRKYMIQHFLDIIRSNLQAGTRPEYIFYTMFAEDKTRLHAGTSYVGKYYPPIAVPKEKRALWTRQAKIPYFNEIPKEIYQSKEFRDLIVAMSKRLEIKKPKPEIKPEVEKTKKVDIERKIEKTDKGLVMKTTKIKELFWEHPIKLLILMVA